MPDTIEVLIEIPRGTRNKDEWDETRGVLGLDRTLYSSMHYPTDYGYIPNTHADDGDHLDMLIIVEEPTLPGCYLGGWIEPVLACVNKRVDPPITYSEALHVYTSDRTTFTIILRLERAKRCWQERIRRRPYEFLLPERTTCESRPT
jgi:hypothetical protein